MLVSVLAVLHIIICAFLILIIMIQDPKGSGGGLFGAGGSNTILGSSGGANFMTKMTRYVGVIFGVLCIGLTLATRPSGSGVFSKMPTPAATAPVEGTTTAEPQAEDTVSPTPAIPTKTEAK